MRRLIDGDLDVACPLCHATVRAYCISTGGHGVMLNVVHRERRQASEEARRG